LVDLTTAKEEAEAKRLVAETNLIEIKQLKDQLEAERSYLQDEIKLNFNCENILGESEGIRKAPLPGRTLNIWKDLRSPTVPPFFLMKSEIYPWNYRRKF